MKGGGVASLASSRIRPNPKLTNPNTNLSAFPSTNNQDSLYNTFTAVISPLSNYSNVSMQEIFKKTWEKDYKTSSFLPDVCSSVFAPGWDITFSNNFPTDINNTAYLTSQGLGSPFVEDMKLCAAMNGMWAAASPDTARVFQGTVNNEETFKMASKPNCYTING